MTKAEFISNFAAKADISKKEAESIVLTFQETVKDALVNGETLQFVGWGTWTVKDTPERMGRNPKTGEEIKIPAKKVVKFKAGKKLADSVNA